ncbi:hypothetical protein Tco_0782155 [Tanacetum coccineum]
MSGRPDEIEPWLRESDVYFHMQGFLLLLEVSLNDWRTCYLSLTHVFPLLLMYVTGFEADGGEPKCFAKLEKIEHNKEWFAPFKMREIRREMELASCSWFGASLDLEGEQMDVKQLSFRVIWIKKRYRNNLKGVPVREGRLRVTGASKTKNPWHSYFSGLRCQEVLAYITSSNTHVKNKMEKDDRGPYASAVILDVAMVDTSRFTLLQSVPVILVISIRKRLNAMSISAGLQQRLSMAAMEACKNYCGLKKVLEKLGFEATTLSLFRWTKKYYSTVLRIECIKKETRQVISSIMWIKMPLKNANSSSIREKMGNCVGKVVDRLDLDFEAVDAVSYPEIQVVWVKLPSLFFVMLP